MKSFVVLFFTCLALSSTQADTVIYKWMDKNGVVSFSQNPPPDANARHVSTMTVQEMPITEQRAAKRMLMHLDKQENTSFLAQQRQIEKADQTIDLALDHLKKAEHDLSVGSVPTGEDRVGNVNGRARLRESYFTRVSDLQNQVDRKRQELQDAYTARDQIMPDGSTD